MQKNNKPLSVQSECGTLRKVLLHRPGRELNTLNPQLLGEQLFDDIPWLERLQEEHDMFASVLKNMGCQVYYYRDLLIDILGNDDARQKIIRYLLQECRMPDKPLMERLTEHLSLLNDADLTEVLIAGLLKDKVNEGVDMKSLSFYTHDTLPFLIPPLPNLYFTRDPGTMIAEGLAINVMHANIRKREAGLMNAIRTHHPLFAQNNRIWYGIGDEHCLEGGDILVLCDHAIAVGCSARTNSQAIEKLASRLFESENQIRSLLVIQIPKTRAYIHLDTVFTMLDTDKFIVYPKAENLMRLFLLCPSGKSQIKIQPIDTLKEALQKTMEIPTVQLVYSGADDSFRAAREQWNDSNNTLAVKPGKVITYKRNVHTNEILHKNGIEVVEIEGSELVRGRGGPRCMSMPLDRDPLHGKVFP